MTRAEYEALKAAFEDYVAKHFDNVEDSFVQVEGVYQKPYMRGAFDMFVAVHTVPVNIGE